MIYLATAIINPWHTDKKHPWKEIYQEEWTWGNNNLNILIDFYPRNLFKFELDINWRGHDHAGPEFDITVLGLGFKIGLTDVRHWNYDKNRWVDYSNKEEVKEWW